VSLTQVTKSVMMCANGLLKRQIRKAQMEAVKAAEMQRLRMKKTLYGRLHGACMPARQVDNGLLPQQDDTAA